MKTATMATWVVSIAVGSSCIMPKEPPPIVSIVDDSPPVVSDRAPVRIWVDQVGYRTQGKKMAVVVSDKALPEELRIELREEKSHRVVWRLDSDATALHRMPFDVDAKEFVAQLDFSAFRTPGRYYFVLTYPNSLRSYRFHIADNPYYDAGIAAWKAFYFSRADGEKPPQFAGAWSHGKAYLGPDQAGEAKVFRWQTGKAWYDTVGDEVIDSKPHDVRGGWWDAGDFNKYTSNTVATHNAMLMAYEMAHGGPRDQELNIPESGNGRPDVLDEIRYGTEFLIRDHDGTGAAFGRVHQEGGCPPESVTSRVQLTMPNSDTTMGRAAALAYAAVVWRESKLDDAFAQKCLDESLRSWSLLAARPRPWPVDPKDSAKVLPQGEMGGGPEDYDRWRAVAAASYFRLTGKKEYDDVVHELCGRWDWAKNGKALETGGQTEFFPIVWNYLHAKGADPVLVDNMRKSVLATADEVLGSTGRQRGYAMAARGYWWGSNSHVSAMGTDLVLGAELTPDPAKKRAYLDGAEEYVHYLFGRNPRGQCYFSNMKAFGVERSSMVMFHSWVGKDGCAAGAKYVGEGDDKIGPFPGMLIGGPNGSMKKLVEDLDWRKNPWEFTEPDIGYQVQALRLLGAFIWPQ